MKKTIAGLKLSGAVFLCVFTMYFGYSVTYWMATSVSGAIG